MRIKLGPTGIGPIKNIQDTFSEYKKIGISAAEIPFTYGVFINKKEDIDKISKASKKFGIELSIHAPYWINLNSEDLTKIKASKKRILDSCKVAHLLNIKKVVFHCGFFGKINKMQTYENIKKRIIELNKEINDNDWKVKLCPETMGKINVFGSIEEISKLVDETNCSFCIDFAHILARDKKINWKKVNKLFPQKKWHCHFSGIEYNEKGERCHKLTTKEDWANVLKNLPKNKEITIINESPSPVEDCVKGLKILKEIKT